MYYSCHLKYVQLLHLLCCSTQGSWKDPIACLPHKARLSLSVYFITCYTTFQLSMYTSYHFNCYLSRVQMSSLPVQLVVTLSILTAVQENFKSTSGNTFGNTLQLLFLLNLFVGHLFASLPNSDTKQSLLLQVVPQLRKYNLNLIKHMNVLDLVIGTNNKFKSLRCMVTQPLKSKVKAVTRIVIEFNTMAKIPVDAVFLVVKPTFCKSSLGGQSLRGHHSLSTPSTRF